MVCLIRVISFLVCGDSDTIGLIHRLDKYLCDEHNLGSVFVSMVYNSCVLMACL